MWYNRGHENTHFYPTIYRGRTAPDPGRIAFVRCFCLATLPDLDWLLPVGNEFQILPCKLGCDDQTVRNVIHGFNAAGLSCLEEGSSRPHRLRTTFSEEGPSCQQRPAASQSRRVWQRAQHLDLGIGRPGQFRAGNYLHARSPTRACAAPSNGLKPTGSVPSTGLPAPIRCTC